MSYSEASEYTILIVDDQPLNLEILTKMLVRYGYQVIQAATGQAALDNARQKQPHLILLDVILPDIDGYLVCQQLKASPQTSAIPIIFISAMGTIADKIRGFEAGGVDFITKPFHVDEVRVRVKTHLDLQLMRQQLEQKNAQLQREIIDRLHAEAELQDIKNQLEQRVVQRTAELQLTNDQLALEVRIRINIEQELRQSQQRLELAIAATGGALWDIELIPTAGFDNQPDAFFLSSERLALLGYAAGDSQPNRQSSWDNHVLAEDLLEKKEQERAHFYGLTPYLEHDYRIRRVDGDIRWIHSRSRIIRADGRPVRWIGIDWDITDRKHTEQEAAQYHLLLEEQVAARTAELLATNEQLLQEVIERERVERALLDSRHKYERLFNAMLDGYAIHEMLYDNNGQPNDYRFLDINPAFERLAGFSRDILGKTIRQVQPNIEPHWIETYGRVARTGEPIQFENYSRRDDGDNWFEVIAFSPVKDQFVTIFHNITERKKAEQALRDSEEKFRSLAESSADHIVRYDRTGRHIYLNPAGLAITGLTEADIIGKTYLEAGFDPVQCAFWQEKIEQVLATGQPYQTQFEWDSPDGPMALDWRLTPEFDGQGQVKSVLGVSRDITTIRRAQAEIERQNHNLRQLNTEYKRLHEAITQAAESILVTDTQGNVIFANPAYTQNTGFSQDEIIGKRPNILSSDLHSPVTYREIWNTITAGNIWHGRFTNIKKSGARFTEDATISPVRDEQGQIVSYVIVRRDVTRELQLEEQYHQAQKMESLGRLTGGVAHDFNNLLTAINGFTELIQMQLPADDPRQPMLSNILHSGQRATDLVRQLLAFSRKQIIEPQVLNLNAVVSRMEKMLRRIIGEDIKLETTLAPDVYSIMFDPAQMEQVIINLGVNARDAMPDGGTLRIKTTNIHFDEPIDALPDLRPGDYVLLAIADTGTGMTSEVLDHIFEPFFTTKEVGKGTGLGLAMVYGIIKQNNGDIQVFSQPGHGTEFKILIPAAPTPTPASDKTNAPLNLPAGSEIILITEDDMGVRELTAHILGELGYNLLKAGSGHEALKIAADPQTKIDLLLTDVVMPDISGVRLAAQMQELRPNLRIMFMSGYTDSALTRHGLSGESAVLKKPFSATELALQVRRMLDA